MKLSPYVFQLQATLRTLREWYRYDSNGTCAISAGNVPSQPISGGTSGSRQTNTIPRHDATWIGRRSMFAPGSQPKSRGESRVPSWRNAQP